MGSDHDREDKLNEDLIMTKTTVVIPNYKGIDYLEDCLRSVYESSVPLKVILVDNASNDGSLEMVRERFPETEIISFSENKGFSAAVNEGIRRAETEFVLLLNNDTVVDANMAGCLEKALEEYPEAFSAAARMLNLKQPGKLDGAGDLYCALGWAFARGKDRPADTWMEPCRVFSACAGCALYRRAFFDEVGLFDENHFAYLEDVDLGYRANICGHPNRYVPEAVVYHAGSASSGSRHNEFKVKLSARNSVYLVCKNMPPCQMLLNLPFLLAGHLCKTVFFFRKGLGRAYLQGLAEGIRLSFSGSGRERKVRFKWKRVSNYLWIQGQLWVNMLRRI